MIVDYEWLHVKKEIGCTGGYLVVKKAVDGQEKLLSDLVENIECIW